MHNCHHPDISKELIDFDEPLFEYACHEGNYALPGTLAGARRAEAEE